MRIRLVPKSMTLNDVERRIRTLVEKMRFTEPTIKSTKIDPHYLRQKCMPVILVSRNIRYMLIFAGIYRPNNAHNRMHSIHVRQTPDDF